MLVSVLRSGSQLSDAVRGRVRRFAVVVLVLSVVIPNARRPMAEALVTTAQIAITTGQFAQASMLTQRALWLDPTRSDVILAEAIVDAQSLTKQNAPAILARLRSIHSSNGEFLIMRSVTEDEAGHRCHALIDVRAALADPTLSPTKRLYAKTYIKYRGKAC